MKIVLCLFLLSLSACSFLVGAQSKLDGFCAQWPAVKGDWERTALVVDKACEE